MSSISGSSHRNNYGYQQFNMPLREETSSQYSNMYDDDSDLEQMVSKFMANSQSAHADLAQMSNKNKPKNEEESDYEDEEELDSDEEFYVHKSLLPMRKSQSSTAGFLRQLNSYNNQMEKERRKRQSEIMSEIEAQKMAFLAEYRRKASINVLTAAGSSIDKIWPEPDPDPDMSQYQASLRIPPHPTVNLKRGDVVAVQVDETNPDMGISDGCWSSPGNFFEDESEEEDDYDSDLGESEFEREAASLLAPFAPRRPLFRSWSSPAFFEQPPLNTTEILDDLYNTPQARRFSRIIDDDSLRIYELNSNFDVQTNSSIKRSQSFDSDFLKASKRRNSWSKRRRTSTIGFSHHDFDPIEESLEVEGEYSGVGSRMEGEFGPNGTQREGEYGLNGTRIEGEYSPNGTRQEGEFSPNGTRQEDEYSPNGTRLEAQCGPTGTQNEDEYELLSTKEESDLNGTKTHGEYNTNSTASPGYRRKEYREGDESENEGKYYEDEETMEADKLLELQAGNDTDHDNPSMSSSIHQQFNLDEDRMSLEEDDFEANEDEEYDVEDMDEDLEDEEEDDVVEPLDAGLAEFSARRRSQFFIAKQGVLPQSKSDSQLKNRKLRGRSWSFNQTSNPKVLKHSHTYHEGTVEYYGGDDGDDRGYSGHEEYSDDYPGLSEASQCHLKAKQHPSGDSQDYNDRERQVTLPEDLVESFALENEQRCSLEESEEEVEDNDELVESYHVGLDQHADNGTNDHGFGLNDCLRCSLERECKDSESDGDVEDKRDSEAYDDLPKGKDSEVNEDLEENRDSEVIHPVKVSLLASDKDSDVQSKPLLPLNKDSEVQNHCQPKITKSSTFDDSESEEEPAVSSSQLLSKGLRGTHSFYDIQEHVANVTRSKTDYNLSLNLCCPSPSKGSCRPSTSRDSHFTEESGSTNKLEGEDRTKDVGEGRMSLDFEDMEERDQNDTEDTEEQNENKEDEVKHEEQKENEREHKEHKENKVGHKIYQESKKEDHIRDAEAFTAFNSGLNDPPEASNQEETKENHPPVHSLHPQHFPLQYQDEDVTMHTVTEHPTTYDNVDDTDEDLPLDVMDEVTGSLEELGVIDQGSTRLRKQNFKNLKTSGETDSEENVNLTTVNPRVVNRQRKRDLLLSNAIPDRAESLPRSWIPDKTLSDETEKTGDLRKRLESVALTAMANALESIERQETTENGRINKYVTPEDDDSLSSIKNPAPLVAKLLFGTSKEDMSAFSGDCTDFPMADDETAIVNIPAAKVPKPALRRRSPPIASEDELSDSEISELERQLATGGAVDVPFSSRQRDLVHDFGTDSEDEDNMPSTACQSELSAHHLYAMAGSSSLPSFAFTADVFETLAEEMVKDQRDQLEETAQWLRKSKTQCFENDQPPSGLNLNFGSRRRILPMRPDDIPAAQVHPTPSQPLVRAFTHEQHQQLRQVIQQDNPNDNIVLATPNSVENAKRIHSTTVVQCSPQPSVHVPRRLPTLPVDNYNMYGNPQPGSSSNVPTVPKYIPRPHLTNQVVPRGTMASQAGHRHEYQLSYGIDQSLVRSTTNYGLEDSYYEDGINGNTTIFDQKHGYNAEDSSGISSFTSDPNPSGGPTHRAQFTFVPRHDDEVLMEVGDALRVDREYEDHWCYGTNLRTGQTGLFPAAHVCEIDLIEEISNSVLNTGGPEKTPCSSERDTFYLTMLASVEVAHHKGNDVLVQAINKVCEMYQRKEEILVPQTVLMEVSFRGIHIIDKRKKDIFRCPTFDYFYSLQNISFCGAHPTQLRYFGFLTKHPLLPRFACHVFLSQSSTQPIVESIGRAFKRSYDEYMAFAHPTEDIYIE